MDFEKHAVRIKKKKILLRLDLNFHPFIESVKN